MEDLEQLQHQEIPEEVQVIEGIKQRYHELIEKNKKLIKFKIPSDLTEKGSFKTIKKGIKNAKNKTADQNELLSEIKEFKTYIKKYVGQESIDSLKYKLEENKEKVQTLKIRKKQLQDLILKCSLRPRIEGETKEKFGKIITKYTLKAEFTTDEIMRMQSNYDILLREMDAAMI